LLHISKIGQGKRVERVEDVLALGQPVEVRVDDIDPQGKVSLSLAGEAPAGAESGGGDSRGSDRSGRGDGGGRGRSRGDHADPGDRPERSDRGRRSAESTASAPTGAASFEEAFEVELVQEFGDLGPAVPETTDRPGGGSAGGRGGRRRR
ncbi:MAG: polyribonucleotide nucleotidyltransferase, partial [Acidimicrobiales bacterium]